MLWFITGYLIGSIPFGLLLAKLAGYGDIRKIGSGNIGATNVLRTGNKKLAALTLLLDGGKGAAAVLVARYIFYPYDPAHDSAPPELFLAQYILFGLAAILGHMFPLWLKFKGGKGVATALGVLLAAVPWTGIAACAVWLGMALTARISSFSALIAMVAAPIVTYFVYGIDPAAFCSMISVIVWIRHKDNIKRLLKGEEPKIGRKNSPSPHGGEGRGEGGNTK